MLVLRAFGVSLDLDGVAAAAKESPSQTGLFRTGSSSSRRCPSDISHCTTRLDLREVDSLPPPDCSGAVTDPSWSMTGESPPAVDAPCRDRPSWPMLLKKVGETGGEELTRVVGESWFVATVGSGEGGL